MATMEKPKVKKKKKTKNIIQADQNEDFENFVLPSTSTAKQENIVSHECFVSAEYKSISCENDVIREHSEECFETQEILEENDEMLKKSDMVEVSNSSIVEVKVNETTSQIQIDLQDKCIQNTEEPTAPSIENNRCTITYAYEPLINYPTLDSLRRHEENLQPVNIYQQPTVRTRPNPFTSAQLKEYYNCPEIEMVKQFEIEFLSNTSQEYFARDLLYKYLKSYLLFRNQLTAHTKKLEDIDKKLEDIKPKIWNIEKRTVNYNGKCLDNKTVKGSEQYSIAEIDNEQMHLLSENLNDFFSIVSSNIPLNKINSELFKLRIEQIVREILSYSCFNEIDEHSTVTLHQQIIQQNIQNMSHLRRAISIFFSFLRIPNIDKIFADDIKTWLRSLIALFLRVATINDHWFLLFHILRCPSGISTWTTDFIQIPNPNLTPQNETNIFKTAEINHCVSILFILLMPIKKRNEFLAAFAKAHREISDESRDELWILVDSDGEEGCTTSGECIGLKENDLINFLNQLPMEMIFSNVINAKKLSTDYCIENDSINEEHLLKLIAFNTVLVELFGEGMLTYNTERYKQFAKRLGRLIRHSIQYVSDMHEMFIRNSFSKDPFLCDRIIVELNSFLIKSCSYIYRTPNLATWQYFSSLPFELLDLDIIWQLYYYLNVGFPDSFPVTIEDFKELSTSPNFYKQFQLTTADLSDEDLYYLIQTFFEMANERDRTKDWEFIQNACLHIFMIGFVIESTRETCYKSCRDMLNNLTLTFPDLFEVLLNHLNSHFNDVTNIIYLFKSLPLHNWKTDLQSFEILSSWLLNHNYEKNENILSRVIISHLNWGFDSNKRLFLPHNIHVRMACLVCESLNKHNPTKVGVSGISESVRQVSNFMDNQNNKDQFTSWCWDMVTLLRLHLMDQSDDAVTKTLRNPSEYLCFIPDLENIDIIYQGVSENCPLAMYISLLVSLWGHSIPLICQKGLTPLKNLIIDFRHQVAIKCIQLIIPLFLDCPETLSKCDSFQEILKLIINADRTYLKMVKDLISTNGTGPVFEHFHNMMQWQIINYYKYGFSTPIPFISLWLQILTNVSNWQSTNVVLLIDSIVKVAYQFPASWKCAKDFFQNYYARCNDWKSDRSSSLKLFFGPSNQNRNFPELTTACGWFSLLILELEHDLQECHSRIWPELLTNLLNNTNKTDMDIILKKTCASVSCNLFPSSSLVIYKFANLLSNANISHPLLPILSQKFFSLFLARVYFNDDEQRFQHTFGVADKFYEQNISLMKKVKIKLKQAEEFYKSKEIENNELEHFYSECAKLMKTFLLWLEETDINKISANQNIELPPQYAPDKLKHIFSRNDQHWTEYLYLPIVRKEQLKSADNWSRICLRSHSKSELSNDSIVSKPRSTAIERILRHLASYDKPLEPPKLIKSALLIDRLEATSVDIRTLNLLRDKLKSIDRTASLLNSTIREINYLNRSYIEEMQNLFRNLPYCENKIVSCSSKRSDICIGPANITVQLSRPHKIEGVERKLDANRENFKKSLQLIMKQNVNELALAMLTIYSISMSLKTCEMELLDKKLSTSNVTDVAISFFYDILSNKLLENIQTNQLYSEVTQNLGIFIQSNQETQGLKILELSFQKPELINLLSTLFVPSRTEGNYFINMYKYLVDCHSRRCNIEILFSLLIKFELTVWLQETRPKLSEINHLLKIILTGLENWNQPQANNLQEIYRRHLVQIFNHEFPEHYGEVVVVILNAVSLQKISSIVLLDLLNSLFLKCGCEELSFDTSHAKANEEISKFATQQNVYDFKSISETISLFAKHFRNNRAHNASDGLYPKHKNFSRVLSLWFSTLSHTAVVTAICHSPNALANQICDWTFGLIIDLYSPWLVPYKYDDLHKSSLLHQPISDNKIFYPWDELNIESANLLVQSFLESVQFILKSLPVADSMLGHILNWYHYHFAMTNVGNNIYSPIHQVLVRLPWTRFSPQPIHIELILKTLNEPLSECHKFFGSIFLQIDWSKWLREDFQNWNFSIQNQVITMMYGISIKISFESNVHTNPRTKEILKTICDEFPLHLIEYKDIDNIFNWLILKVEPIMVLRIPFESNEVNELILRLLKISCGMMPGAILQNPSTQITSKQILYINSIVRMLRLCTSKHKKLIETQEGRQCYRDAIVDILNIIDQKLMENNFGNDRENEAQVMIAEIICSLQTQNEYTAKLFVDAIISWQANCNLTSPVLPATLNSIGLCKTFVVSLYLLLETTIYNYFRIADDSLSWKSVLQRLDKCLDNFDLMILLSGSYLLSLHAFVIYKIQNLSQLSDKIIFLQDVSQLLEKVKIDKHNEARIAIVWGAIITCGCEILQQNENVRKPLLMLGRQLQVISKQSDGWGGSILGAIGIKTNKDLNRQKVITRCLSCLIFILFPDKSSSNNRASQEFCLALDDLINECNNKNYNEIKFETSKAINMISENKTPSIDEVTGKIFQIIKLFYDDIFIKSVNEIWHMERCS